MSQALDSLNCVSQDDSVETRNKMRFIARSYHEVAKISQLIILFSVGFLFFFCMSADGGNVVWTRIGEG